ncbi:MAG: endonuclease III [Nanoarchaeota archaeon]
MNKKRYFLEIFVKAERKYGSLDKRLAGECWKKDWQVLIATIMSAQTRDEVTIPVAEKLFARYENLEKLSRAKVADVLAIIRPINFSPKKARFIVATSRELIEKYNGEVPDKIEELTKLEGVGRKTANLVLSEIHNKDSITCDTHVHRLSNVLGLVKTKNPTETEFALMKIAPRNYWSRINRIFVLWGQDVRGRDKKRLLSAIE